MLMDTGIAIHHSSGESGRLLYDEIKMKYWDSSLKGGTYSEQMNYIAYLNSNYRSSEWGPWRLARSSDIQALPLGALFAMTSLFKRTDDTGTKYVYEGRYDEISEAGKHSALRITWTHIDANGNPSFEYAVLPAISVRDDFPGGTVSAGRMGAWIVADAALRAPVLHRS